MIAPAAMGTFSPITVATPIRASCTNVSTADVSAKEPVIAAATAKRKQTRPDASFSSDSPSSTCRKRFGTGARAVIAETATGSVGETIAASANATGYGIAGIIQ